MNATTLHILNRFSNQRDRLVLLMAENLDFYSLCQDYEACVYALEHWARSDEPEAKIRIDEYRTLVRELEDEVAHKIRSLKP